MDCVGLSQRALTADRYRTEVLRRAGTRIYADDGETVSATGGNQRFSFRNRLYDALAKNSEHLSHTPCLGKASAWLVRSVTAKTLLCLSNACLLKMAGQAAQQFARMFSRFETTAVHAKVSRDKRPQHPWPDCALMIGGVATVLVAAIMTHITGIGRGERTES